MAINLGDITTFWTKTRQDADSSANDGSASNKATSLESFNPEIGLKTETTASSDTGSFSVLQFLKRLLSVKLPATLSDGGNFKTAITEALPTGSNTIGSVSVSASALPSGAATAANQATEIAGLASIDGKLTGIATSANQATANTSLSSIDTKLSSTATAANQSTANTSLSSIDTKLSSTATAAKQDTGNSSLSSIDTKLSSAATAANQSTANTSLSSIDTKLTGVATAANQSTANTSLASIDSKMPALVGGNLPVDGTVRYSATSRSSTISSANTWQQLAAANTSRKALFIHNPATNSASIDVGLGAASSEFVIYTIAPGNFFSIGSYGIPTDRVSVRCSSSSVAFYAFEG